MSIFDPIFDLLAGLLAWFYSLVPSYGFAIIALTTLVLLVFSPLTYRSTKSMVAMRRVQPQVRKIQKKYRDDRERMNQEMMKLYQEHNVSPLSGCLPMLVQSPVFIVMFRVLRGITRRSSDIGFDAGRIATGGADAEIRGLGELPQAQIDFSQEPQNFNPEYLDPTSDLYQALVDDNEMLWLGIDLSRTPLEVLGQSLVASLPYLAAVALVGFLSWYQQRQIAGRATGEVSAQQQMIMRIIPWMLPIFSFTMPGGLVLYFIVSSLLRVLQQAYLTRTVYADESLTTPLEVDDDDDDDDDDDNDAPENPFAALFGGGRDRNTNGTNGTNSTNGTSTASSDRTQPAASSRHGSRRPVSSTASARNRARPPRDRTSAATNEAPSRRNRAIGSSSADDTSSGWGRAKRSAASKNDEPAKPASRRVTPKGGDGSRKQK